MNHNELKSKKKFGDNLKIAIHLTKTTQEKLAEACGISARTMSAWCNNETIPKKGQINNIQDILKINLTTLEPIKIYLKKSNNDPYDAKEEIRALWRKIGALEEMIKSTMEKHHGDFKEAIEETIKKRGDEAWGQRSPSNREGTRGEGKI